MECTRNVALQRPWCAGFIYNLLRIHVGNSGKQKETTAFRYRVESVSLINIKSLNKKPVSPQSIDL